MHGDVKPDNILFSFEGVPKLSDFNAAKALATISKTKPGYTPGYVAPEQLGWRRRSQRRLTFERALKTFPHVG